MGGLDPLVYPMCRIPTENKQLWSEVLHVLLKKQKYIISRQKTGKNREERDIFKPPGYWSTPAPTSGR